MFGNDNTSQPQSGPVTSPTGANNDDLVSDNSAPAAPAEPTTFSSPASVFPPSNDSANNDPFGTAPAGNNGDGLQPHKDEPAAPADSSPFADVATNSPAHTDLPQTSGQVGDDGLIDIKQQALQQLSPLVKHLDQSPEEQFKTTMMMIQASDDQSLIPEAFEAAKKITDDKARAQALLDIINEINYFTQNTHN